MNSRNESRVSQLRRNAGWTQERLSEQSGVPVRTIQRLEAGNETSLETLSRVADALKVEVRDLFVITGGDGFTAAIDGLDGRRAQARRRHIATNIVGWSLTVIGVLIGVGGAWSTPDHLMTYAVSGLVIITAGLGIMRGRPEWLPIGAAWVTAATALVYMLTFGWIWWVYGCAAVAVIGLGAAVTWPLVIAQRRNA